MIKRRKKHKEIAKQVFELDPKTLRIIRQLSAMSKYSEQQVLEDLLIGGIKETTELYEQIKAWRLGEMEKDEKAEAHSDEYKEVEGEDPTGPIQQLDNYPPEATGDYGAVERALAAMGASPVGRGQLPEGENGAESPHEDPDAEEGRPPVAVTAEESTEELNDLF